MKSALSAKAQSSNIVLVDKLEFEAYRTKIFVEFMKKIGIEKKSLFVFGSLNKKVIKSAANVVGVRTSYVGELNVYDILNHDSLVLDIGALDKIEGVYV